MRRAAAATSGIAGIAALRSWHGSARFPLFALAGLLAILLACTLPASATGHYDVTYDVSGTQEVNIEGGNSWTEQYYLPDPGQNIVYSDPENYAGADGAGTYGSTTCSGAIVAHCVWVPSYPGEPAPLSAIVCQHCTASWVVDPGDLPGATFQASCSDGLGDSEYDYPDGDSGISTGTHYSIKGGDSFDITCSPQAQLICDSTGGASDATGTGPDGVPDITYSITVTPVTIGLIGAYFDTSDHIYKLLTGQGLKAGLGGGRVIGTPSWSVSGGQPFASWVADQTYGTYTGVDASLNQLQLHCYFAKQDSVTISASATVDPGDGSNLSVSAKINLSILAAIQNHIGSNTNTVSVNDNALFAVPFDPSSDEMNNAVTWYAEIDTPDPFKTQQGTGRWNFVQLITPGRWYTPAGGTETAHGPAVGETGCDGTYPYRFAPATNSANANGYPANGGENANGDSPSEPTGRSSNNVSVRANDGFSTWIMFEPPAADTNSPDVTWVPLYSYAWHWRGTARRPDTSWPWGLLAGSYEIKVDAGTPTLVHPEWIQLIYVGADGSQQSQ